MTGSNATPFLFHGFSKPNMRSLPPQSQPHNETQAMAAVATKAGIGDTDIVRVPILQTQ